MESPGIWESGWERGMQCRLWTSRGQWSAWLISGLQDSPPHGRTEPWVGDTGSRWSWGVWGAAGLPFLPCLGPILIAGLSPLYVCKIQGPCLHSYQTSQKALWGADKGWALVWKEPRERPARQ